jgi:hypothetical protein
LGNQRNLTFIEVLNSKKIINPDNETTIHIFTDGTELERKLPAL